ncbi:MAG: PIN domain-containing protein [Azoarcus sp.]|jgi:predicted nucleic acid-binding protein|nr:PIN domain-containing protein [Azoarcus sp.]
MPGNPENRLSDSCAPVYAVSGSRKFADSNVPLYLLSPDARKAATAQAVLHERCFISVQVLNEMTSVMRRKHQYTWPQVAHFLATIRSKCPVEPLTVETHDTARRLAERYQINTYDALIAAAALLAGCDTLYSEDMQHGLVLENTLHIVNPFLDST